MRVRFFSSFFFFFFYRSDNVALKGWERTYGLRQNILLDEETCWECWKRLHQSFWNNLWLWNFPLELSEVTGTVWSPQVINNPIPPMEFNSTNSWIATIWVSGSLIFICNCAETACSDRRSRKRKNETLECGFRMFVNVNVMNDASNYFVQPWCTHARAHTHTHTHTQTLE